MSTRSQIEFYDGDVEGEYGGPSARIYQHSDGYPTKESFTPLGRLLALEKILKAGFPIYGARSNDPEWAAAEYISQFREKGAGNIYVSHSIHGDIEYLYRVVCNADGWKIHVFRPEHNVGFDIVAFKEMTSEELAEVQG